MRTQAAWKEFYKMSEAASIVGVPAYVLRFWERQFSWIKPQRVSGGHRRYSKQNIEDFLLIKRLLKEEGFTIEGARKHIRKLRASGQIEQERKEQLGTIETFNDLVVLEELKKDLQNLLELVK